MQKLVAGLNSTGLTPTTLQRLTWCWILVAAYVCAGTSARRYILVTSPAPVVANDLKESYGERSATGGNRTYILVRYALHTAAFLRRYAADCFTSHADTHQAGDSAAWLLVRAQT